MSAAAHRAGLWFGLAAYAMWGLFPLYFVRLRALPATEVLAHRIVWSLIFLLGLILVLRSGRTLLDAWRDRRTRLGLSASAVLIAVNWLTYIYAVTHEQTLQASLGYFITPLVNVACGVLILGERLRPLQWASIAIAGLGVANDAALAPTFPWLALALATTFGMYGLMRKLVPVEAIAGLAIETSVLFPAALAYLAWMHGQGTTAFGTTTEATTLLVLSGPLTALPLLCFAAAARRLPLAVVGVLQFLAPSIQFVVAVGPMGEPFGLAKGISFGLIWLAVALFAWDARRHLRSKTPPLDIG